LAVDSVLSLAEFADVPLAVVKRAAQGAAEEFRSRNTGVTRADYLRLVREFIEAEKPSLSSVINCTGVILHTGAGRAVLAAEAAAAVASAAGGHSNLELDLETGERGSRHIHVEPLLKRVTGAPAGFALNNAAGALIASLSATAFGKKVLVSRGQLVEIGGGFRIPDIIVQSGCKLVEVGTTNRTHLKDYEGAWDEETAAILVCHPSNFTQSGFVSQPDPYDLAKLAHSKGGVFIDDQGSGCLVDTSKFGIPRQRTVQDALASGADVVIFSGDKLLGGPQAGILVGTQKIIERIKKHPFSRALRIDKLCLAGLEATLRLYADGKEMQVPTLNAFGQPTNEIKEVAVLLAAAYGEGAVVVESTSEVGGGAAPGTSIPTYCTVLRVPNPGEVAKKLRQQTPAVLTRVQEGAVWLDPRTVQAPEIVLVEAALRNLKTC
jgi:L-seryl-tRNA(Ser) seleniumtransferase